MMPWPAAMKADLKQQWQIGSGSKASQAASPTFAGAPNGSLTSQLLRAAATYAGATWRWLERRRSQQLSARRLRLTETISLGEKRSVSIIQVNDVQYLIGHCAGSVQLLAKIDQQNDRSAHAQAASFAEAIHVASHQGVS